MVAELFALPAFAFGVTYLLHSTLLLGGAWLVTRRMDRRALRLRERVWKFAVLGGFVTAGLQSAAGVEPLLGRFEFALASHTAAREVEGLDLPGVAAREERRSAAVEAALAALDVAPAPERSAPAAQPVEQPAPSSAPAVARSARTPVRPPVVEPGPSASRPREALPAREPVLERRRELHGAVAVVDELPLAALGGWLLAGLASLGLVAFGLSRLRRELAGAIELESGAVLADLERLAARAGLARRVRLLVAPRLAAPLSTGWLRPRICVPPRALQELAPEEFEAVLAHEVAHLARRDPPWLFALWLIETVCFFQPLNRLARRELSRSFELSADAWAARATGDRLALAGCLARIAGWIVGSPAPGAQRALGAAMADTLDADRPRSRLGERILRLLDPEQLASDERPGRGELPLGLALLGGLALAVPGAAAVLPGLERAAVELAPGDASTPVAPDDAPEADAAASPAPAADTVLLPREALPAPEESEVAPEQVFGDLDLEMEALAEELELLRRELAEAAPDPRWDAALEGLEQRTQGLEAQRQRMQVVLEAFLAEEAGHDARRFGP